MEYPLEYNSVVDDSLNGKNGRSVDFVDVGCGFGGLLSKSIFPSPYIL
jgi:hypothetical protein